MLLRCPWTFAVIVGLMCVFAGPRLGQTAEPGPPPVRVVSVSRVFHNGEHNAFTDLCRFGERLYLTFRSCPDGHQVFPSSSILVLSSEDGEQWTLVHRFSVPLRDTRDPHFLVFRDKLFVYTGTWYCGEGPPANRDMNQHLGYATFSEDGQDWTGPIMLEGTYGHYIWRAATDGEQAYLCGRRKRDFVETASRAQRDPLVQSAMLVSEDGLVWRWRGCFQEVYGDETAFLFQQDRSILAVARSGAGRPAQVCRSAPPYTDWTRTDLDRYIGGPLLARWNGRYVVGGRKTIGGRATTSLCWLVDDQLREFAELPSGGDNSYPGFLQSSPTTALVSYYSSHEQDDRGRTITAIYLVRLELGDE